jgi:peptidoglycan-associated lipoprotein
MRINRFTVAAIAAALAVTGCAKKPPKELPPPPGNGSETTGQNGAGDQSGGVGNAAVPGSRADFLQSVPSDRIYFDTDSYTVDDEDRPILNAQAAWLQRNRNVRVTIEGHADERGTREYNLALGDRRANAAKNYLSAQGIDESRMMTISYGKERPAALGSDEEAWAKNRRAVTIIPE